MSCESIKIALECHQSPCSEYWPSRMESFHLDHSESDPESVSACMDRMIQWKPMPYILSNWDLLFPFI